MRDTQSFVLEGRFKDNFSKAVETSLSNVSDAVTESERKMFNSLAGNFQKYQGTVNRAAKELKTLLDKDTLSDNEKIDLLGYFYKLDVDEASGLLNEAQKELTATVREMFDVGDLKPNQMFRVMQEELKKVLDDLKTDFNKGATETKEFEDEINNLQNRLRELYKNNAGKSIDIDNDEIKEFYQILEKLNQIAFKSGIDIDVINDDDILSLGDLISEFEIVDKWITELNFDYDSFIEKIGQKRQLQLIKELDPSYFQSLMDKSGNVFNISEDTVEIFRKISEELSNIRKLIGEVDDDNGFKNIIESLNETLRLINEINPKVGKGIFNVSLGGNNDIAEKAKAESDKIWEKRYNDYVKSYEKIISKLSSEGFDAQGNIYSIITQRFSPYDTGLAKKLSLSSIKQIDNVQDRVRALVEVLNYLKQIVSENSNATDKWNVGLRNAMRNVSVAQNFKAVSNAANKPLRDIQSGNVDDQIGDLLEGTAKAEKEAKEWKNTLIEIKSVLDSILGQFEELSKGFNLDNSFSSIKESLEFTIKGLTESIDKLSNIKVNLDYDEADSNKIDSEINDFSQLENKIGTDIVKAIHTKNEALDEERKKVDEVVSDEIKRFDDLRDHIGFVKDTIQEKNDSINEEGIITNDTVNKEKNEINSLKNNNSNNKNTANKNNDQNNDTLKHTRPFLDPILDHDEYQWVEERARQLNNDVKGVLGEVDQIFRETKGTIESYRVVFKNGASTYVGKNSKETDTNVLRTNQALIDEKRLRQEDKKNIADYVKNKMALEKEYQDAEKESQKVLEEEFRIRHNLQKAQLEEEKRIDAERVKNYNETYKTRKALEEQNNKEIISDANKQVAREKLNTTLIDLKQNGIYVEKLKHEYDELVNSLEAVSDNNEFQLWNKDLQIFNEHIKQTKKEVKELPISSNSQNIIDNFTKQYENIISRIKVLQNDSTVNLTVEGYEEANQKILSLEEEIKTLSNTDVSKLNESQSKKIQQDINIAKNAVKELKAEFKQASFPKTGNVIDTISKMLDENTKYSREAKRQLREFYDELTNSDIEVSAKRLQEILGIIQRISASERDANRSGKSFFDGLKDRITSITQSAIAMSFSMYDVFRYAGEAFNTIRELDDAFTEMRKVSDESVESLKNYQKASFGVASQLGTTALALQNSTADWLRLGESMDEAAESAKAATILLNVSEFESIDAATQSLVSASQAYKELDKMEIIDVLNNIGNNFSISTDQLAEGLQNAAAVLKTQGNDLNEAVALLTAGKMNCPCYIEIYNIEHI